MAFSLRDVLRFFTGGEAKKKSAFESEEEAYDFCKNAYEEAGGVTPELRRAYEFYVKNYNDDTDPVFRPGKHTNLPTTS